MTVLVNIVLTYEYVYNTYFYSPMQKVYRISVCTEKLITSVKKCQKLRYILKFHASNILWTAMSRIYGKILHESHYFQNWDYEGMYKHRLHSAVNVHISNINVKQDKLFKCLCSILTTINKRFLKVNSLLTNCHWSIFLPALCYQCQTLTVSKSRERKLNYSWNEIVLLK